MKKLFSFVVCAVIFIGSSGIKPEAALNIKEPVVTAKAYVLIESDTGTIISAQNENMCLPMASITKIMSALLTIESGGLDEEFTADSEAVKTEGSTMGLLVGDIVTKRALCYGMLLPSGNDAANCAAVRVAGDYETFAKLMNNRAARLGMRNTNFVTASGLHDENHYSTAYDMALLTMEAIKNDTFREIFGTKSVKLSYGNPPYDRWIANTNKLMSLYKHCTGGKTGFTDEAGRTLVSVAEKGGVELICITLNDANDWSDHISLFDYGFSRVESKTIPHDRKSLTIEIAGGESENISLALKEVPGVSVVNGIVPDIDVKYILPRFVYAPVESGTVIGTAEFYADGRLIGKSEVISTENCGAVVKEKNKSIFRIIIDFIKQLFR